jgi:hypothetical protein
MTAAVNLSRRCKAVLWTLIFMLLGCSSEPPAPATKAPSESVKAPLDSAPASAARVPWNSDTLKDGEFTVEEGFRTLTLSDFEPFFAKPPQPPQSTWLAVHDAIVCFGKPKGYLYSKEKFADFTLRLELRFAPVPANPGQPAKFDPQSSNAESVTRSQAEMDARLNTGVMLFITEPHKQWPKSLEVQGRFADMATIKENGGAAKIEVIDDDAARRAVRKPVGEWNAIEVVSKGGVITSLLNGTKVCEGQTKDLDMVLGMIGLQSEDFEVHFRRLRIRPE